MLQSLRSRKNRSRLSRLIAPTQWETLEARLLLSGTAPSAAELVGDTLVYFKSAGTGIHAPPRGTILTFTSGSDVTLQEVNGGNPVATTYTYVVTGASSATLVRQATDGTHTLNFTFSTDNIGTIQQIDPDGSSTDIFAFYQPTNQFVAPSTLANEDLIFNISTGGGTYPVTGSWRSQTAADGRNYTDTVLSGTALSNSTGSRSYTPGVESLPGLARTSWSDNLGASGTMYLAFGADGGGVFYTFQTANPTNFVVGTFTPTSVFTTTTTAMTSTFNPATLNGDVHLTATITPHRHGADIASGTIIIKDGDQVLGNGGLDSNGSATLSIKTLALGRHNITAVYSGDNNFSGSISPALVETIVLTPNDNTTYMAQVYADLLHRDITQDTSQSSTSLSSWAHALDLGVVTLPEVITAITSTAEYDGVVVNDLYARYLGRESGPGERQAWVNQMQAGLNADVIRAEILASDEYFALHDSTNAVYVTALYRDLLGRAIIGSESASWLSLLLNNPSPADARRLVTNAFSNSTEARAHTIAGFYRTYLNRGLDTAGLNIWVDQLNKGVSQPVIITFFVSSPEYLALHHVGIVTPG